jgi:hypothetical protein
LSQRLTAIDMPRSGSACEIIEVLIIHGLVSCFEDN